MKNWLINNYLPMWAKETVLKENRRLRSELAQSRRETELIQAYADGMTHAMKVMRKGERK